MDGQKPAHLAARMGRWSARHRKLAITLWLAFVVVSFAIGAVVGTKELSDVAGGTGESGRAERMIADAGFPETDREAVLIQSSGLSPPSPRYRVLITEVRGSLQKAPGVRNIEEPRRSDDGRTVLIAFEYEGSDIDEVIAVVERIKRAHPSFYVAQFGDHSAEKAIDKAMGTDLGERSTSQFRSR
jgi:hypothetical protein